MSNTRQISLWMIITVMALVVVTLAYDQEPRVETPSLAERCSELGGEWLYKSADLICLQADGSRLAYDLGSDSFLPDSTAESLIPVVEAAGVVSSVSTEICDADVLFVDFAVDEDLFTGRPRVDFSTNQAAQRYRTAISKDVARGVNFASKYVVSTWGCGEGCKGSAVINAETGKILSYGLTAPRFSYQSDSRLLMVGYEQYYEIQDDELVNLCP